MYMKKFVLTTLLISLTLLTAIAQNNTNNHIVQKGETLYRLSVKYKLSIPEIPKNLDKPIAHILTLF